MKISCKYCNKKPSRLSQKSRRFFASGFTIYFEHLRSSEKTLQK
nr:MAG TPA: hypothetical protein [Caudoviricetes sp.]